jgi:transcriptional regulator with XRE-family HTH domain
MSQLRWFEDPKELRKRRKELGITQHGLAKLAKVKRSLISDIEAGRRPLSEDVRTPLWQAISDMYIERLKGTPEWAKRLEEGRQKLEEEKKSAKGIPLKSLMVRSPQILQLTPGLIEHLGEIKAQEKQIIIQEREIAALRGQVAAQAEQIAALRDLLDLKTKEVLLRDKIESEHTAAAMEKKETAKHGDD